MTSTLTQLGDTLARRVGFKTQATYLSTMIGELFIKSSRSLRDLPLTAPRLVGTIAMTTATDYALPAGFRSVVEDSAYIEDNTNEVLWGADPEFWASLKATDTDPGNIIVARQMGGRLHIHNPSDGVNLKFEYWTSYLWTDNAGTTPLETPTAENDKWKWDDELILLDVAWRYKREKGDEWQIDASEFKAYKNSLIGTEFGVGRISMGGIDSSPDPQPYTPLYIP